MALSRQARMLSQQDICILETFLSTRQDPLRETTILYLSVYAGLRAKEIACLDWSMLVDARGDLNTCIALTNAASKGKKGGRVVPMHPKLVAAIRQLRAAYGMSPRKGHVIMSRNEKPFTPHAIVQKFRGWYAHVDMQGCSSHSGRRTFITQAARTISLHGGSLRDVQDLAGHAFLSTTQGYIVLNEEAKASVVANML